jgi:hypothetical protein
VSCDPTMYTDSPKAAAKKAAAALLAAQQSGTKPPEKIYTFDKNGDGDSLFEPEDQDLLPGVPNTAAVTSIKPVEEIKTIEGTPIVLDMPEDALGENTLAEICHEYMGHFPRAYAFPALLTVAGTMMPMTPPPENLKDSLLASAGLNQTNLFTTLIGPVGSGKSQAIFHAVHNLRLQKNRYTDTKAGSIEGLLAKLQADGHGQFATSQMLCDLDEWSHFFKKAGIDNASFVDVLNTAFNKSEFHLTIAGGKKIDASLILSLIGGMVTDNVEQCFGASSTGGFHDRFLFGVCPTNYVSNYQPFNYAKSAQTSIALPIDPCRVEIDPSVWEVVNQWRRSDPTLSRIVEITVRCAVIIASFDRRAILYGRDVEKMRPFLEYQKKARYLITPNPGLNANAQMCNAIRNWLNTHAPKGEWVTQRSLKKGIHSQLDSLGAQTYVVALKSLAIMDSVETTRKVNPGARPSDLVRLIKGS